ncbi:MAG: dihydroneopterin aldolase [Chitinophagaceae bacterium]
MAGIISIELHKLRFFAKHGLYGEEKLIGNEYEITLSLSIKAPKEFITSVEQTINYVEVYKIVQEEMNEAKLLLETFVMNVADRLQKAFPELKKINISIKKLHPPIVDFMGSVGVCFEKEY